MRRWLLAFAALLVGGDGLAQEAAEVTFPVIREVVFEGNDTTRPSTMLREMSIRAGDPADPVAIERARQAVQDLGLFREVNARIEPVGRSEQGGVRVVIAVREKYYFIPSPRADANSDGQYGYGAQLRWYNFLGLNHTLRATVQRKNRQDIGRGAALLYDASYDAPFLFDSAYSVNFSFGHSIEPVAAGASYDDVRDTVALLVSRKFDDGAGATPASQGWKVGTGFISTSQTTEGEDAPPPFGRATGWVLRADYRDVRYRIHSESGVSGGVALQNSFEGFASDYDYSSLTAYADYEFPFGKREHQTVKLFAAGGTYHGGPADETYAFDLGGAHSLRGYPRQFQSGDSYYHVGAEVLRPLYWDWLRGLVLIEAGNTATGDGGLLTSGPDVSVGVGLRLRFSWFVKFQFTAGIAVPLTSREGISSSRFFAASH